MVAFDSGILDSAKLINGCSAVVFFMPKRKKRGKKRGKKIKSKNFKRQGKKEGKKKRKKKKGQKERGKSKGEKEKNVKICLNLFYFKNLICYNEIINIFYSINKTRKFSQNRKWNKEIKREGEKI